MPEKAEYAPEAAGVGWETWGEGPVLERNRLTNTVKERRHLRTQTAAANGEKGRGGPRAANAVCPEPQLTQAP